MRLTVFTDYSLRVLIYLAAQPGRRATIGGIAESFRISGNHLGKVVYFLGKHGWLANVRGKGGGLELARPPVSIRIGEVVRQTEGADVPAECFGDGEHRCAIARVCGLRDVFRQAVGAFYEVLDRYTLADLVQDRAAIEKVLFPRAGPSKRPSARLRPM